MTQKQIAPKPKPKPKPDALKADRNGAPDHIRVFFDIRDGSYLYRLNGRFAKLSESQLRRQFRALGLRDDKFFEHVSELEWPFLEAERSRMVDYSGPIAGHRAGLLKESSGLKYLITDEAAGVFDDLPKQILKPELFIAFVTELLPGDQALYFFHWLTIALRSLRAGTFRRGQAVILCGPHRCGKSLLQYLITEVLGGRASDPYGFFMGSTTFNRHLVGSEHWCMEDPSSKVDLPTRREFGDRVKAAVANRDITIHAKNKDASLSIRALKRVTLSINNGVEHLMACFPIDEAMEDKAFLFKCAPAVETLARFRVNEQKGLLTEESEGEFNESLCWKSFMGEIAMVRAWLLKTFHTVPLSLRDDRFGIRYHHDREIKALLSSVQPEVRLLTLCDAVLWEKDNTLAPWTGKAIELDAELRGSKFGFEADKVLRQWSSGHYLGRLSRSHPERVQRTVRNGYTYWIITAPAGAVTPEKEKEAF